VPPKVQLFDGDRVFDGLMVFGLPRERGMVDFPEKQNRSAKILLGCLIFIFHIAPAWAQYYDTDPTRVANHNISVFNNLTKGHKYVYDGIETHACSQANNQAPDLTYTSHRHEEINFSDFSGSYTAIYSGCRNGKADNIITTWQVSGVSQVYESVITLARVDVIDGSSYAFNAEVLQLGKYIRIYYVERDGNENFINIIRMFKRVD
jgi:hypothetical protein